MAAEMDDVSDAKIGRLDYLRGRLARLEAKCPREIDDQTEIDRLREELRTHERAAAREWKRVFRRRR